MLAHCSECVESVREKRGEYRIEQDWIRVIGDESDASKTTGRRLLPEGELPRPGKSSCQDDTFKRRGNDRTCANSRLYCSIKAGSTETSAGASAGAATNSRAGLLKRFVNKWNVATY